jgi:hypothetical protein
MPEIEIFVQGEAIPEVILLRVPSNGTVRDILKSAETQGVRFAEDERSLIILIEDQETELSPDLSIEEAHIGHRSRIHVHRCHRIEVTVNFNAAQKIHTFPPSATVERVKRWAVGPAPEGFGLQEIDATEHLLQLCNSTTRPDEEMHIGSLVTFPDCGLCFDLVPKVRVEG